MRPVVYDRSPKLEILSVEFKPEHDIHIIDSQIINVQCISSRNWCTHINLHSQATCCARLKRKIQNHVVLPHIGNYHIEAKWTNEVIGFFPYLETIFRQHSRSLWTSSLLNQDISPSLHNLIIAVARYTRWSSSSRSTRFKQYFMLIL